MCAAGPPDPAELLVNLTEDSAKISAEVDDGHAAMHVGTFGYVSTEHARLQSAAVSQTLSVLFTVAMWVHAHIHAFINHHTHFQCLLLC